MAGRKARKGGALALAGWAALAAPCSVLLHELGHFAAGQALGYSPVLRPGSVSGGARLGQAPGWEVAVQAGAGPLVTILLTLTAIAAYRRGRARLPALALAAVAPVRILVASLSLLFDTLAAVRGGTRGVPNFDEYNMAAGLGVPVQPLSVALTLFLVAVWVWAWRRFPARRAVSLAALVAGAAAGLAIWFNLVGPPLTSALR